MKDCVFCKIINKELPSKIIFENDEFLAFSPINMVSNGHTLLIPKKHFKDIFDFETQSFEKLMGIAQKISKDILRENNATGLNLLQANGKDAQQSVFHFHLHLVPRYKDDGLDLWFKNKL
jgi:histidine triad (HIT) family protein